MAMSTQRDRNGMLDVKRSVCVMMARQVLTLVTTGE